jgi:hypothetical protein
MVVLTDEPRNRGTPFEPTGANIMAVSGILSTQQTRLTETFGLGISLACHWQ